LKRKLGGQHLKEKGNQKRRQAASSVVEHESNQGTQLLEEINGLINRANAVPTRPLPVNAPDAACFILQREGVNLAELPSPAI